MNIFISMQFSTRNESNSSTSYIKILYLHVYSITDIYLQI